MSDTQSSSHELISRATHQTIGHPCFIKNKNKMENLTEISFFRDYNLIRDYNFHDNRIRKKFGLPLKSTNKDDFYKLFPFMSDSYFIIIKLIKSMNMCNNKENTNIWSKVLGEFIQN